MTFDTNIVDVKLIILFNKSMYEFYVLHMNKVFHKFKTYSTDFKKPIYFLNACAILSLY